MLFKMKKVALTGAIALLTLCTAFAQMPTDGFLMKKGQLCNMLQYNHNSWTDYWQGTEKRSNTNLGTLTTQSAMLMSNYGITDKLNVMAALPWVKTSSSVSYLQGQSGIQDFSLWLKWQPYMLKLGNNALSFQTTGGVSIPASDYLVDFLPFSIGAKCRTASLRGIVHFSTGLGLYATAQAGHTWRSNVELNRNSYFYDGQLFYGNKVPVPNVFDATLRIGFLKSKFQVEVWGDRNACITGDDIRYNDMPNLTNKMQATAVGGFAKYWITPKLALSAGGAYVLNARNMGQSTSYNGALFYLFNL
jgi:hypothetical protein